MPWVKAWRMFWGAVGAGFEQLAMTSWDIEDLFDEPDTSHTDG